MIKFRTISHLLKIFVYPEVEKRIKKGTIKESGLPLELFQFRAIQRKLPDGKVLPIVELNQEVNLKIEVKAKRQISAGEPLTLNDIYPEECFISPPVYDGQPAAYFLCQHVFFDYLLLFDCRPNVPSIAEDLKKIKNPYPILDLINNKDLYDTIKPIEKIEILSNNNWPPAPGYYPQVLYDLHKDPTLINSPDFLEVVSKAYGTSYWAERFAFWDKTNFFPKRLPYLKRALDAHFNKDYIASIYILVPQFEGIIKDYLIECGQKTNGGFKDYIKGLKELIFSRKILMFPRGVFEMAFEYLETGSFWENSYKIKSPSTTINRHGIAHGVFTGFECEEISLKYLILLDLLSYILLHDKMLRQSI